jgi:hypothetical protein
MTFPEATELAVYAKELFPRATDAQAAAARDMFATFPDGKFVRVVLQRLATETTVLPLPMIRAELQSELRRRGETSEEYAKQQERLADQTAVRQKETVDRLVGDFSDDEIETLKPKVLDVLRQRLNADGIEFIEKHYAKLNPRRSRLIKTALYKAVTA